MRQSSSLPQILGAAASLLACSVAAAATVPSFPSSPSNWLYSQPMRSEGLKGKLIIMNFYEEN